MLAHDAVAVNEDLAVRYDGMYIRLEDVRYYSPELKATMELEDAVTLAKAILEFVGETTDTDPYTENWLARLEEEHDARHDAVSAHFAHD